jgi:hypothetical protein
MSHLSKCQLEEFVPALCYTIHVFDVSYMFKPPVNEFSKADLVVHQYQAFFVYVATHV